MKATLVATLTEPPTPEALAPLAGRADVLEVRADLLGDPAAAGLRAAFPGELLYTLRSRAQGGASDDGAAARRARLLAAASAYDLVDLEGEDDFHPDLLEAIPPERRLVSWHGEVEEEGALGGLRERFARLAAEPARYYKLVTRAAAPSAGLAPLALLKSLGRGDVAAFASGACGAWSRLLAPRLGAPLVFAAAGPVPGAPGQPPLETLARDYGLPELPPLERLYGVVGHPVGHSLSPRLHNRVYRELGLPALFLAFEAESFGDFWLDLVEGGSLGFLGFPLEGLAVTAPYKEIALAVAGATSPLAERIGSANTLVRRSGVWEAETTDAEGVREALEKRGIALRGRRAAVLGAGGAGRAAGFGLARAGVRVTLVNRGEERGQRAAAELGLDFLALDELDAGRFDLLVNATPLGRDAEGELPFDPEALAPGATVIDLAYLDGAPTRLVAAARAAGRTAIDGREVLLAQAIPQFRLMTGRRLPADLGREILGLDRVRPAAPEGAP